MNIDHLSFPQQCALHREMNEAVRAIFMRVLDAYNKENYILQGTKRTGKRLASEYFNVIECVYQSIFAATSGFIISDDKTRSIELSITRSEAVQLASSFSFSRGHLAVRALITRLAKLSDAGLLTYRQEEGRIIIRLSLEIVSKIDEISAKYAK